MLKSQTPSKSTHNNSGNDCRLQIYVLQLFFSRGNNIKWHGRTFKSRGYKIRKLVGFNVACSIIISCFRWSCYTLSFVVDHMWSSNPNNQHYSSNSHHHCCYSVFGAHIVKGTGVSIMAVNSILFELLIPTKLDKSFNRYSGIWLNKILI